jgi:NTP pyrophosphatase (non-canonical NTP hydrolase)
MLDFNEYQARILDFMNPETLSKGSEHVLMNAVLGLCGEAGEVADNIKKWMYHGYDLDVESLDKEVGDVLFYCALYANGRGVLLSDIAQKNVDKLTARYPEGFSTAANKAKADENN